LPARCHRRLHHPRLSICLSRILTWCRGRCASGGCPVPCTGVA
jgi:hypothetical protein